MKHLWGGRNFSGPAVASSADRIKISCLFWLLFVVRQKVTREEYVKKYNNQLDLKKHSFHFGIEDSPIFKIHDRNKTIGIPIHHGLRCMEIYVIMKKGLAPYPWLMLFSPLRGCGPKGEK
jgi:hypothetical protein